MGTRVHGIHTCMEICACDRMLMQPYAYKENNYYILNNNNVQHMYYRDCDTKNVPSHVLLIQAPHHCLCEEAL